MAGWPYFFALAADAPGQEQAWTFTLAFLPRKEENSGLGSPGQPKTDVVVAVIRLVVVAGSRARVIRLVVPRTAPKNAAV